MWSHPQCEISIYLDLQHGLEMNHESLGPARLENWLAATRRFGDSSGDSPKSRPLIPSTRWFVWYKSDGDISALSFLRKSALHYKISGDLEVSQ